MTIHEFPLPALLEEHLKSGGREFSESELRRLKDLLTRIDSPRPRFLNYEQIVSQHDVWGFPTGAYYLGTEGTEFVPGRIDPKRTLIIGEADEDSPIALDYRTREPRVVYLGSVGPQGVWIELASSYDQFLDKLQA